MASPINSLIQRYDPKTPQEYENALKEIIQEVTLAGLARAQFFEKAAFYGGTALRIFYGLPRFSEDLDFTLLQTHTDFKLSPYFGTVTEMLNSFGFDVEIREVKKSENRKIESAFLKANTRIHLLKIATAAQLADRVQSNKTMDIKFEVDIYPPLGFESEVKVLAPPITASVKVLKPSSLFGGKMHAILFRSWKNRAKGRDFYDLLWYLGQRTPLKLSYLEEKMKDSGHLAAKESLSITKVKELLADRIKTLDWESAKRDVANFLRDRREVDSWNPEHFLSAIESLEGT